MERFKNILFVYTGQKDDSMALKRAIDLARTNKSKLSLLAIYEQMPSFSKFFLSPKKVQRINESIKNINNISVEKLTNQFDFKFNQKVILESKNPFEIISQVIKNNNDLIIKIKEEYDIQNKTSNLDMRLLRKCPCPVWIINGREKGKFSRILAAIDANPTEETRLRLHVEILKLATSLARQEDAQLDILYAWEFYGEATLRGPRFRMSDEDISALAKEEKAVYKKWLDDMVAPFLSPEIKTKPHLIKGPSSKTILDFIQKKRSDLLIMGTVARVGIPGFVIGNTAETVLGKTKCSTLTIKPPGFKSMVV